MKTVQNASNPDQLKLAIDTIVRQFDNTGTITLASGTTSTTIVNTKVKPQSVVITQGANAAAKAEEETTYVSVTANNGFTITHLSNAIVRKVNYVIFGI